MSRFARLPTKMAGMPGVPMSPIPAACGGRLAAKCPRSCTQRVTVLVSWRKQPTPGAGTSAVPGAVSNREQRGDVRHWQIGDKASIRKRMSLVHRHFAWRLNSAPRRSSRCCTTARWTPTKCVIRADQLSNTLHVAETGPIPRTSVGCGVLSAPPSHASRTVHSLAFG